MRPQVLVTYDQFGNYGHPDHIQAHRVAMYAAQLAAVPSYRHDLGEPWEIAKIYWTRDVGEPDARAACARCARPATPTTFEGMDPDGPLPMFVTPDDDLSRRRRRHGHVEQKMDAMRAHRTQITVDGPFFALSNNVGTSVVGRGVLPDRQGQRRASPAPTGSSPTSSPVCEGGAGGGADPSLVDARTRRPVAC